MAANLSSALFMIPSRPLVILLSLLLACSAVACRNESPVPTAAVKTADAPRSKEQAMAALMGLPELQAWSAQIEKASNGTVHPALVEDAPGLQTLHGKQYWQFTYAVDSAEAVQRRATFLVAAQGQEILVRDFEHDTTISLAQWRAGKLAVP